MEKDEMGKNFLRVAHLSVFRKSIGVQRQLIFEYKASRKLQPKIHWHVQTFWAESPAISGHDRNFISAFITPRYIPSIFRIWVARWRLFRWLERHGEKYDIILLRWPGVGPLSISYAYLFEKVFTVHHTKEIQELQMLGGIWMNGRARLEANIGPILLRRVRGIIGVTNEIIQYELDRIKSPKQTFLYPNGIGYEDIPLIKAPVNHNRNNRKVVFLMVASRFFPWHGLDLIFQSFQELGNANFLFHVVGHVPAQIRQRIGKDRRFRFHGLLNMQEIFRLARHSDIGVSSMALFRNNMVEACPLKAREYLALGLPVIGGYRDSGLPPDFPYYHQLDLRNKGEAQKMMDIAKRARAYHPKAIREESRPFIEKVQIMKRLLCKMNFFC